MTRSNSLIYTLVLGGGALLFFLSACAAPNSAPTLAPTAPAPQTATPVPPTALAVRTATKVLPTDLPTIAPTRTELPPTATREVLPTVTPIPDVTRVISPTITASQVISDTPQADPQTAALITTALQKTRALENYHGFIKFQIGQALVENWNGDLDGDVAQYTHFSDWFSEDVEILLKDGKHYERPYSGGEYGVWREIPQAEVKDNFFHAPSEMVAELVIEPEAYRKTDTIDVEEQQCDLYTHELVSPVSDALFGVSQQMRFPVSDQGTGGLAKAAAVLAICPDGYIHLAGLEFTPKEFLDAGYVVVVLSKFNQVPTINVPDEFK